MGLSSATKELAVCKGRVPLPLRVVLVILGAAQGRAPVVVVLAGTQHQVPILPKIGGEWRPFGVRADVAADAGIERFYTPARPTQFRSRI